jgi:hypothetical protein
VHVSLVPRRSPSRTKLPSAAGWPRSFHFPSIRPGPFSAFGKVRHEKALRDWSVMDVLDLRRMLAKGDSMATIAVDLKRDVGDVTLKAEMLNLWGQTIPLNGHWTRSASNAATGTVTSSQPALGPSTGRPNLAVKAHAPQPE